MIRTLRYCVLAAGTVCFAALAIVAPAGAATMGSHVFALHGAGQFGKAMASATVTQVSKGDFKVSIMAERLPSPAMLHVKPLRHVYVAWLIDSMSKGTAMMYGARLSLMYDKKTGNYTASGTVMATAIANVVITAEPNAMAHAPAMPEITALTSAARAQM
jgi:hypothetical protein